MRTKEFTLHIGAHYTENLSVKELARNANITVYYFCRIFKRITGKTMTDYLRKSNLTVTEIALKCGFDSVNYYSRLFRKYYHVSPTTFRENNIHYSVR